MKLRTNMRTLKRRSLDTKGGESIEARFLRLWVGEVFQDKNAGPRERQAADAVRREYLGHPDLESEIPEATDNATESYDGPSAPTL